jgi:hypothetical protein
VFEGVGPFAPFDVVGVCFSVAVCCFEADFDVDVWWVLTFGGEEGTTGSGVGGCVGVVGVGESTDFDVVFGVDGGVVFGTAGAGAFDLKGLGCAEDFALD